MQKGKRKKDRAYKAAMLLKYWKATKKEPIRDLCMIIAMYTSNDEVGLLYAVGSMAALITNRYGHFRDIDTLSRITLRNKDKEEEALVKGVMNGSNLFHAFLSGNGTVRVVKVGFAFDIALDSDIITMSSGNYCKSLFIIDKEMYAYEIEDKTPTRVTELSGLKIKDISCGDKFTVFLSEYGRVFGIGENGDGRLGLPYEIRHIRIPVDITFPIQSGSDNQNKIIITMIHASQSGWIAVDSEQQVWVTGRKLMKSVRSDYKSLDPCISTVEVWCLNGIRITQIKCGYCHVVALDTKGKVYWFGKFHYGSLSHASLNPIPFSHRITVN